MILDSLMEPLLSLNACRKSLSTCVRKVVRETFVRARNSSSAVNVVLMYLVALNINMASFIVFCDNVQSLGNRLKNEGPKMLKSNTLN
jgi:hypothetical protein